MENQDKDRRFLPDTRVLSRFDDWYSRTKLFDKIGRVAKKAGVKGIYAALLHILCTRRRQSAVAR